MNKESPPADAPVPPQGTEQAADQAVEQQPPPAESGALDTVASVLDGAANVADVAEAVFSILG